MPTVEPTRKTGRVKRPARKTTTTSKTKAKAPVSKSKAKTPAKKATTKREPCPFGSPWAAGSNQSLYTEQLIGGGKRSDMVKRLVKKGVVIKKRGDDSPLTGEQLREEIDLRLQITSQLLEKEGWTKEKAGRGAEATLKVSPPKRRRSK